MAFFFIQTTQDNLYIFEEFALRQANKHTDTTFKMKLKKKEK